MNNSGQNKDIFNMLSQKLGKSPQDIESGAKQGKVEDLIGNLPKAQQQKVKDLLSDPEQTKKLLSSPVVQSLIRKLQNSD
ncbi:MAG: hypothetical protein II225_02455 [Ruminococcus sp.]|nr:hypothetical protein [Ruminococcus sp.]